MAEDNRHIPPVGHEETDADASSVGRFGAILVLVLVLSLVLLFGLFRYFQSREGAGVATVDPTKSFPEPRLQKTPVNDLKEVRDAENQVLHSYAWVDPQKGVVRIPIDRAIDLLAQHGLPSRPTDQAPPASGVTVPTESSLGPKMQQPGGPLAGEPK
jgi:hypothetical protein